MATEKESTVVYAAALVQGIVLVTFPAASTVFTSPDEYDLLSTRYGLMFVPQVLTAVLAALLGGRLAGRVGTKKVYIAGLAADLLSMVLLVVSQFFVAEQGLAYTFLLLATACLGVGFGLVVPALNTLTAVFHADQVDRSVLVLNALLGLGTTLAPVFVAIFVGLGFWWGLPVLSVVLLAVLILVSLPLALRAGARAAAAVSTGARTPIPTRFWVFAAFALLYGVCETMNGNWAQLEMTRQIGASTAVASLALTAFWGMVTVGRVLFAAIQRRMRPGVTYRVLPFVLALALILVAVLPHGATGWALFSFGLAGLGCSALLPLTLSFAQEQLAVMSGAVAGGVIAFYQVGYGVAAFGSGPLQDAGVGLPALFAATAVVALALAGLATVLAAPEPVPSPAPA